MNRRNFLTALALAPVAGVVVSESFRSARLPIRDDAACLTIMPDGRIIADCEPMTASEAHGRMEEWYGEAYEAMRADQAQLAELYNREIDNMILRALQRT
jgi:hypothetical protein